MKKFFLILTIITLLGASAEAQIRFGVKAGVNLSGVSIDSDENFADKNITGFQVGPQVEWLINGTFGLEGGVIYSQRGIKFVNGENTNKNKNGYIDIPVSLKYKFNASESIKPFLAAGPYVSLRVSGDDKFGDLGGTISDQWKAKTFAAGLNFGAGLELMKFLQIGVNYGLGLTDDYGKDKDDIDNFSAKTRTWSVTAAIYF